MTRRLPLRLWAAPLALALAAASPAKASTLTITPDKSIYQVGEDIVLTIDGDPQDNIAALIFGRILFNSGLAIALSANQTPLTYLGMIEAPWTLFPLTLGPGFADAFNQSCCGSPVVVNGPLVASVTLSALAPGALHLSWNDASPKKTVFFDVVDPQGATVTIIPEPSTGLLLALGLSTISAGLQVSGRGRRRDV